MALRCENSGIRKIIGLFRLLLGQKVKCSRLGSVNQARTAFIVRQLLMRSKLACPKQHTSLPPFPLSLSLYVIAETEIEEDSYFEGCCERRRSLPAACLYIRKGVGPAHPSLLPLPTHSAFACPLTKRLGFLLPLPSPRTQ